MKILGILFIAVGMFTIASCDEIFNENFEGKGPLVKRTIKVGSFDEVEISGSMKLFIRQGAEQRVIIESQANILDRFEAKTRSGRLEVEMEKGNYRDVDFNIYITVPYIKYIGGSGASEIELSHFNQLGELELDFSGATEFKAVGKESNVDRLIVDISGAGELAGFLLKCRRIDLDLSGASSCEVYATETLNLDISGASEVRYKGNPRITQDVSGASSVESVN
jgi:hypothetical protein|tara:strand:+ start:12907 stop:13575 length:669 start_codon:yes stop_codon:yes gene_type:complete